MASEVLEAGADFPPAWIPKRSNAKEAFALLAVVREFCARCPVQLN